MWLILITYTSPPLVITSTWSRSNPNIQVGQIYNWEIKFPLKLLENHRWTGIYIMRGWDMLKSEIFLGSSSVEQQNLHEELKQTVSVSEVVLLKSSIRELMWAPNVSFLYTYCTEMIVDLQLQVKHLIWAM